MTPSEPGPAPLRPRDLAALIDHSLLRPDARRADVEKLCDEATRFGFAAVCVNPAWVRLCAGRLAGSPVRVCSVVAFPFGAVSPEAKAFETRKAREDGASEFDMVVNLGALKDGDDAFVVEDIRGVVGAAGANGVVKVILETAFLTDEEKVRACRLARQAGAHFVKTSTGFGPAGATVKDVALMRRTVGEKMGVKAAGGIRDLGIAMRMVEAGATRLGTSSSVKILKGAAG